MSARRNNLGDMLGDGSEHRELGAGGAIQWGTVGWDGDKTVADTLEVGDGTSGQYGRSLVRVTLFAGRDITQRPVAGAAQGRPVRCHLPAGLTVPIPVGAQVMVAFPNGDLRTNGNGGIVFVAAPAAAQFSATRGVLAFPDLVLGDVSGDAGDGLIHIQPTGIAIGNNADDAPAAASIVDANFKAITDFLTTLLGPPSTIIAPAGMAGGPCTIATPAPSTNATKSNFVTMKK